MSHTSALIRHWFGVFASAIPLLFLSYMLFRVWIDPRSVDDGHWVPYGVGLLAIEFLVLHSGAFLGAIIVGSEDRMKRMKAFAGLLVFYLLCAWGMAMAVASPTLLLVFCGVTAGRVVTIFTTDKMSEASQKTMTNRSALGIVLYIGMTAGTIFLPIPELGITGSVLADVYPNRGGGLWERDPERALAGGAVYFMLLGLAEIFIFGRKCSPAPATKNTLESTT